ncbi:MAG TPA: class I SAM-dependent methyltransferase [Thermoanaerobaculia bacterium]|nr:class I SAM-dependent methyltransferase [Thermoanaerobaculia bacterium]
MPVGPGAAAAAAVEEEPPAAAPFLLSPAGHRVRERQAWDRTASRVGDFSRARSTQYYRRCEIALIERWLGPLAGRRVLKLDLWNEAYNTRILHWMAGQGADVAALDGSGVVAARARANTRAAGLSLGLLRADIRELPFAEASFDLAYTMGTIEHIAEYRQALRELHRVLRPGGRAIVGVPHRWNLFLRPLLVTVLEAFDAYPYAPEKSFGASELRRDLRSAGFRVLDRGGLLITPGPLRMLDVLLHTRGSALERLTGRLVAPFEALERRWAWTGRFGYLLAMQVEKAG